MAGLKFTLVRAAIALLIVEGVVRANHASMKNRRAGTVDASCGTEYASPCCSEDIALASPEGTCFCRCVPALKDESKDNANYCPVNQGPTITAFTLVPLDTDEGGDSAAGGGTASIGHTTRPNGGIVSYMMWIGIVFTVIMYVNQIAQRH